MKSIQDRIVEQRVVYITSNGEQPSNIKLHQNLYAQLRKYLSYYGVDADLKGEIKTYMGMDVEVIHWDGNSIILY